MMDIITSVKQNYDDISSFAFKIAQNLRIEDCNGKKYANLIAKIGGNMSRCCEVCGNTTAWVNDDNTGDVICGGCGFIASEKCISSGKDWRSYNIEQENQRSRVGPKKNMYVYDGGLATTIDTSCKDSKGQTLSASERQKQKKLKKTQDRFKIVGSQDRNFTDAMNQLHALSQSFQLTKQVKEEVVFRYRKIVKDQLLKGRTIQYILVALIYIIQAELKIPFAISDVCKKGNISETDLTKYRKKVYTALQLNPKPILTSHYLNTIHRVLHLDQGLILQFSNLLYQRVKKINPLLLQGKYPSGIASGMYYLAANILQYDCTQHQIREVLDVTDVTVRTRYREIVQTLFSEHEMFKEIINNTTIKKEEIQKYVSKLLSSKFKTRK
jgi:transcription initiation factor TFIIB